MLNKKELLEDMELARSSIFFDQVVECRGKVFAFGVDFSNGKHLEELIKIKYLLLEVGVYGFAVNKFPKSVFKGVFLEWCIAHHPIVLLKGQVDLTRQQALAVAKSGVEWQQYDEFGKFDEFGLFEESVIANGNNFVMYNKKKHKLTEAMLISVLKSDNYNIIKTFPVGVEITKDVLMAATKALVSNPELAPEILRLVGTVYFRSLVLAVYRNNISKLNAIFNSVSDITNIPAELTVEYLIARPLKLTANIMDGLSFSEIISICRPTIAVYKHIMGLVYSGDCLAITDKDSVAKQLNEHFFMLNPLLIGIKVDLERN